jgi:hypothetical protein
VKQRPALSTEIAAFFFFCCRLHMSTITHSCILTANGASAPAATAVGWWYRYYYAQILDPHRSRDGLGRTAAHASSGEQLPRVSAVMDLSTMTATHEIAKNQSGSRAA